MTDVELAVESYLSISLVTYLSDIEWLTSFLQRNYLYISIRHGVYVPCRPYIWIIISKRYHNVIFSSAPVLKSDFWHRTGIVFSAELDMSVQSSVAFNESISKWHCFHYFLPMKLADIYLILNDRRDVEGEFHRIDIIPMSIYVGLHGTALLTSGLCQNSILF